MARGASRCDDDECSDVSTLDPFYVAAPCGAIRTCPYIPPDPKVDAEGLQTEQ